MTFYPAERHFVGQGYSINKHKIRGWISKLKEIFQNSDKKAHRLDGGREKPLFPHELEDIHFIKFKIVQY